MCLPLQVGLYGDVGQTPAVSMCSVALTYTLLNESLWSKCHRNHRGAPGTCRSFCRVSKVSSLRYLCCSCEADLWDWITSFLRAQVRPLSDQHCALLLSRTLAHFLFLFQNNDPAPPVMRRHSSSDISKQKFGTMPLVPIRGDESNSSMLSANQTLVSRRYGSDNCFRARAESILHALTCQPRL